MKKPKFIIQDSHKKIRLRGRWKRPRGLHSKMRLKRRGRRKSVSVGYRTAKKERGLYKGLKVVYIDSMKRLKNIDSKKEGIIISNKTGLKKKIEILKEAERGGIGVINMEVKKFLKNVEELLKGKEEKKKEKEKEKVKKKEEKEKTAKKKEEEKTLEKKIEKSEEDVKKEEKQERDKVLTKKED